MSHDPIYVIDDDEYDDILYNITRAAIQVVTDDDQSKRQLVSPNFLSFQLWLNSLSSTEYLLLAVVGGLMLASLVLVLVSRIILRTYNSNIKRIALDVNIAARKSIHELYTLELKEKQKNASAPTATQL